MLHLSEKYQKVPVNVLNKNVETLDLMPVSLTQESCDGSVKQSFLRGPNLSLSSDWRLQAY